MHKWYQDNKKKILEIIEDYGDPVFQANQNELILNQFWPMFITINKIYFLYGLVILIINNILQFMEYNKRMIAFYSYLIIVLPIIFIVYDSCCKSKLSYSNQKLASQIIFIVVEIIVQLYLYQLLLDYENQQRFLAVLLIFMTMIISMAMINNIKVRTLILIKFFIYLGYLTDFSIFTSSFTYHIVLLIILLLFYWDKQIIQLSKVKNFAEQSLRSVPTAVCIMSCDCTKILFSNRYMKKLIERTHTKTRTYLTKSMKQDFNNIQTQQSINNSFDEVIQFFSQMFANIEEVKNQLPFDASKFNLENIDDEQINLNYVIQHILGTDKKTQGKIYTLRCQFIDNPEFIQDESSRVVIEVKIKTLLQYEENKHAILINLYDISTNLKSIYYKNLNQFKSKVIRSISHELRTRLNAIQGMIQMVQISNQKFDFEVKKYLKAAYNNCRIQNFIIGSIIDYNLLRERQLPIKLEKVKINFLISEVIELFRDEAELKNIKIKYEEKLQTSNFELLDQEKFQSIIIHIISNSIKFNKPDGLIIVKLTKDNHNYDKTQKDNLEKNQGVVASLLQIPENYRLSMQKNHKQIPNTSSPQQQKLSGSELGPDSSHNKQQRLTCSKYKVASQFSSIGNLTTNIADSYLIEIKDNGIGIQQEKLEYIRSLLNSEDSQIEKTSDSSSGMMLGLRASNQLIKNVSGKDDVYNFITIDSEFDKGTCVQMHIRVKLISGEHLSSDLVGKESVVENEGIVYQYHNFGYKLNPFVPSSQLNNKNTCSCENTFMIVDDEPYNLIVLESLLNKLSHQVVKAENGKKCIQLLEKMFEQFQEHKCKGFKGIIMDYQMPIMNGEEATKHIYQICKEKNLPPIPIFGLTGFSGEDEINRLLESGMREVYVKPITIRTLEDLISNISKSEYRSFDYVSNISQPFQFIDIEYADDDKLVLHQESQL